MYVWSFIVLYFFYFITFNTFGAHHTNHKIGFLLIAIPCLFILGVILKYAADAPSLVAIVGPIHGFFYMVYLAFAFDLSLKCKWQPGYTVLVLLAGTIPFLSFVAERKVTHRVQGQLAEASTAA